MEGADKMTCYCTDATTTRSSKQHIRHKDFSGWWKAAAILIVCICSTVGFAYVLHSIYTTKLNLAALQLDIDNLRLHSQSATTVIEELQQPVSLNVFFLGCLNIFKMYTYLYVRACVCICVRVCIDVKPWGYI